MWRDAQQDYLGKLDYCQNPTSSFAMAKTLSDSSLQFLPQATITRTLSHLKLHVNLHSNGLYGKRDNDTNRSL